jgi:hypothetical protein
VNKPKYLRRNVYLPRMIVEMVVEEKYSNVLPEKRCSNPLYIWIVCFASEAFVLTDRYPEYPYQSEY